MQSLVRKAKLLLVLCTLSACSVSPGSASHGARHIFEAASPHLQTFLSEEQRAAVTDILTRLPDVYSAALIEVHMNKGNRGTADISLVSRWKGGIARKRADLMSLLAEEASDSRHAKLAQLAGQSKGWAALAQFATALEANSTWLNSIARSFVELDTSRTVHGGIPPPNIFIRLDDQEQSSLLSRSRHLSQEEWKAQAHPTLALLVDMYPYVFGREPLPALVTALEEVVFNLPSNAEVRDIGFWLGRPGGDLRVNVALVNPSDFACDHTPAMFQQYMESIGYYAAGDTQATAATAVMRRLCTYSNRWQIALDVTDGGIGPRIGFEILPRMDEEGHLLALQLTREVCTWPDGPECAEGHAEALEAWISLGEDDSRELSTQNYGLIAWKARAGGYYRRGFSHVKVSVVPDDNDHSRPIITVKPYLSILPGAGRKSKFNRFANRVKEQHQAILDHQHRLRREKQRKKVMWPCYKPLLEDQEHIKAQFEGTSGRADAGSPADPVSADGSEEGSYIKQDL